MQNWMHDLNFGKAGFGFVAVNHFAAKVRCADLILVSRSSGSCLFSLVWEVVVRLLLDL
uniref:Uncharacterized protein n=1 Tax=Arundo donax TaxID=35708 RepID=A0A0A9C1I7_ARUDO